jgi:hypothetical protein
MLQTTTRTRRADLAVRPAPVQPRLLALLSPPRSFSSVISTMIGQHPEMYGFPELHLMMDGTLRGVLKREHRRRKFFGPPGMLRTLAELDGGEQTVETVFDAHNWIYDRRDWSTKQAMDYVMDRVAETETRPVRICVEKSPAMTKNMHGMNRMERSYPDALYLHLTRHPLSTVSSMEEYINTRRIDGGWTIDIAAARASKMGAMDRDQPDDLRVLGSAMAFAFWVLCHTNIMKFTQAIPPERVLRVKGEDILSEPDIWLPKICRWAGVDDGPASVEAMLHPEESPYAVPGPINARGGNDGKFLLSPKLRRGRVREGNLREALSAAPLCDEFTSAQKDHLLALANFFGYQ